MSQAEKEVPTPAEIEKLVATVQEAHEALKAATERESNARRERTEALNRANECQRRLDKALAVAREVAPRDTDWKRSTHD